MICIHAVAKIFKEEYKYSKFKEHSNENSKIKSPYPGKIVHRSDALVHAAKHLSFSAPLIFL